MAGNVPSSTAIFTVANDVPLREVLLSSIAMGTGGFAITGESINDYNGWSVSAAGDVNGDGLADLLVGAPTIMSSNSVGRSYVVFGKTSSTEIHLSQVAAGTGGFAIIGETADDRSGYSVSAAGDVNGDGLSDLFVGAPYNDLDGTNAGRSYVVFGKTSSTAINLSQVVNGTGGFVIIGQTAGDRSGYSVSAAGDVNGDGLSDLIVGAPYKNVNGINTGRSYVVFGKTSSTTINLSQVANGTGGFSITGETGYETSGGSVSAAGDVNGDGLSDLIVGDTDNLLSGGSSDSVGRSYVVFGKAIPVG